MHSQTASAPQFFDRVPDERVGKGVRASANKFLFSFLFAPFFLGFLFLFLFLFIPNFETFVDPARYCEIRI